MRPGPGVAQTKAQCPCEHLRTQKYHSRHANMDPGAGVSSVSERPPRSPWLQKKERARIAMNSTLYSSAFHTDPL